MRAPEFWNEDGLIGKVLVPAGFIFSSLGRLRRNLTNPVRCSVPVICIGNLVTGGAGKTPVSLSLANRFRKQTSKIHFLTRGYGGTIKGPYCVNRETDIAVKVGDEALLLAAVAPTWIARDRVAGAFAAVSAGANAIIMDDGFQNPSLYKDLSILVIDGEYGFGNQRVLPAGPLRETVNDGLARADVIVIIGSDKTGLRNDLPNHLPVLTAHLVAGSEKLRLAGQRVIAFSGIGRPGKFFQMLPRIGCEVLETHSFPDHYQYRDDELSALVDKARMLRAKLVTTEKDAVRMPNYLRSMVEVLTISVSWDDETAIDGFAKELDI